MMDAAAAMKKKELRTKIYNSSDPVYGIAAAAALSGGGGKYHL